jgi:hypothetical protein
MLPADSLNPGAVVSSDPIRVASHRSPAERAGPPSPAVSPARTPTRIRPRTREDLPAAPTRCGSENRRLALDGLLRVVVNRLRQTVVGSTWSVRAKRHDAAKSRVAIAGHSNWARDRPTLSSREASRPGPPDTALGPGIAIVVSTYGKCFDESP